MKSRYLPILVLCASILNPLALKAETDYSLEFQTAGAVDEEIDALTDNKLLSLDERQDLLCSRIEEQLTEVQAMAVDLEDAAFKRTDNSLKAMYKNICEDRRFDLASLSKAEGNVDQLEASIAYSDILVKKKYKKKYKNKGKKKRKFKSKRSASKAEVINYSSGGPRILNNSGINFPKAHAVCAPGCGYVSWGIWGDAAHRRRRSCHNSGDAIDIHGIRCGGTVSVGGSSKFRSYVDCMVRQGLGAIYNRPDIGKANRKHTSHAHFQLPNCRNVTGR